jgi:hypothetical protein
VRCSSVSWVEAQYAQKENARMSTVDTILHVFGHDADAVEQALTSIFAHEDRPTVLRLEGTFSAVLERLTDPDLDAAYRYLILQPHEVSRWTPVLELGNRTEGLDVELSRTLDGAPVFTIFDYGETVSGYTLARGGVQVDHYLSDPTWLDDEEEGSDGGNDIGNAPVPDLESLRGHPERFAELLPSGTAPEDFARVVLTPGWWEDYSASTGEQLPHDAPDKPDQPASELNSETEDEGEIVDERDRMRCIALALELWSPTEYPLTDDLEDIANKMVGPGIILVFN